MRKQTAMKPSKMRRAINAAFDKGPEQAHQTTVQQYAGMFKDVPKLHELVSASMREIHETAADPTKPAGSLYKLGDAPAMDALYKAIQDRMPHDMAGARVWDMKAPGWYEYWKHMRTFCRPEVAHQVTGFHARGCRFVVMVEMAAGPHGGSIGCAPAESPEEAAMALSMLYVHMMEKCGARQLFTDFYADDKTADAVGAVLKKIHSRTVEMTTDELQAAFAEGR